MATETFQGGAQIAFVFDNVARYQALAGAFQPEVEVHVLDAAGDGLERIAAILAPRRDVAALHVLGHGSPGALNLGAFTLDAGNVDAYGDTLGRIGGALTPGGDILLYGCDVAADARGARFVDRIAKATGADVAASTNPTGGARRGGDWALAYRTGPMSAVGAFDAVAVHDLDTLLATNEDVTSDMDVPGAFVPGFTILNATPGGAVGDPSHGVNGGIYFDAQGGETETFTIGADGTSVRAFDLTGMTWVKADPFGEFTLTVTGHKTDGTTATAVLYTAQNATGFTVTDDFSDMTGLQYFDVAMTGTSADATGGATPADLTLDAFTVDNVVSPPTVTNAHISISSTGSGTGGTYKIGDTVTAVWDGSATGDNDTGVTGVTIDFSAFGGGVAVAATDSGGVWTASYTLTAGAVDATNRNVSVTATSGGGNTTAADSTNLSVDTIAPTVTDGHISISGGSGVGGAYKVGDTVTATWDNSAGGDNNADTMAGVTVDFSQFGGGSAVAATNSGGTWIATYTVTGGSIDGANHNVSVTATDNAGNVTTTADTTNATVDNIAPTVTDGHISISGGSGVGGAYRIGDTVTVAWDNTAGGDNNTDTLSGVTVDFSQFGGGSAVAATNSGGTWTATYTITAGAIEATNRNVSVTVTDNAGNVTSAADTTNATVDNIAPTLTITSDAAALHGGQSATITFTFSEDPGTSFTAAGILVSGGTLGVISGTGATRTAVFTPDAHADGTATIFVDSTAYTDLSGNLGDNSAQQNIAFDTTPPTVVITSDTAALHIGETATITFTFSEDPGATFSWDGTSGDVVVGGGTLSALSGTGLTRTAVFTPDANTDGGAASITVAAGAYTDAAGNSGGAGTSPSLTFDTLAPNAPSAPVLASASDTGTSNSDAITTVLTPTLTGTAEAGATVKLYDGATLVGTGTADGGGAWSITTATLAEGAHSITATATDAAGNTGAASASLDVIIDTTAPTLTITSDKAALLAGETATITFTFSEDPGTTFSWDGTSGDVAVSGGTLSAVTGAGNTRTAVFTPDADVSAGTASITVAAGAYADAAGNAGGAGATPSLQVNTLAPTVTITSDKAALHIGETAVITFTFSADPGPSFTWDGASGDVAVSGGTLSAISGAGATRTAVFTPDADTNGGAASITIGAGAYTDGAGNGGQAGGTPSLSFDTRAPAAPSALALEGASDTGASSSDHITRLATPTLSGTAEAGATVKLYDGATLVGTGTADGGGHWSIAANALAEGAHSITATATDAAGNAGAASGALALTIDTTAPTLAITSDKATLHDGETATITFTFSEDPGASFHWDGTSGDVVISGGALSAIAGTGNVRTATFTPDAHGGADSASITVAAGAYSDAAGNSGGAGATPSLHIDTAPTVSVGPGVGGTPQTGSGTLNGGAGDDWLQGQGGNDILHGGGGSNYLDGGAGLNTAVFDGAYRQYAVATGGASVSGGPEGGTDVLANVQRVQFVDGYLATSPTDTAGQAFRLYTILDRTPDAGGLADWTHAMNAGQTLQSVAEGFVSSAEFQADYGALDNRHFVELLYHNVLHRDADAPGLSHWVDALDSGQDSRAQVVLGFSESQEEIAAVAAPVQQGLWIQDAAAGDVARLYDAVFGRLPDAQGLADWTHLVKGGLSLQAAAADFLASPEFQGAHGSLDDTGFVTLLYQNALHRPPDTDGLHNWIAALNSGHSRAEVAMDFSMSAEHVADTAAHIEHGVWIAG